MTRARYLVPGAYYTIPPLPRCTLSTAHYSVPGAGCTLPSVRYSLPAAPLTRFARGHRYPGGLLPHCPIMAACPLPAPTH